MWQSSLRRHISINVVILNSKDFGKENEYSGKAKGNINKLSTLVNNLVWEMATHSVCQYGKAGGFTVHEFAELLHD